MNHKGIIGIGKRNTNNKFKPKTKALIVFSVFMFIIVALMAKLVFSTDAQSPDTAAMMNPAEDNDASEPEYFNEDDPFGVEEEDVADANIEDENPDPAVNNEASTPEPTNNEIRIHKIGAGDNFSKIARKYYGDGNKYWVIQKANPNVNPNRLQLGQEIKVPPLKTSAPAASNNASTPNESKTSNTNNSKKNETEAWLPEEKTKSDEPKTAINDKKSKRTFPWEFQEQPDVPDDSNAGRVEEYVVVEETTHMASAGDTPEGLALKYYSEIGLAKKIKEANPGISWTQLSGGEKIRIPKLTRIRVISPKKVEPTIKERSATSAPLKNSTTNSVKTYVVQSGDNLSNIARRFLGSASRYPEIMRLNNMSSDRISIGMKLKIPQK